MIKQWEDKLTFGAHKDYTVLEVVYLKEDADYVVWLIEQTERTEFSIDVERAIYLAKADQRLALLFDDLINYLDEKLTSRRDDRMSSH